MEKFKTLYSEAWESWIESIDDQIESSLNEPIFRWQIEDDQSRSRLSANLPNTIFTTAKDVKYLISTEVDVDLLTPNSLELYSLRNEMWKRKNILLQIEDSYNEINDSSKPCEFDLIFDEIVNINDLIDLSCATVIWKSYGKLKSIRRQFI